jgi:hypothetical protein
VFGEGHIDEAETLQREALASEIRQQGPDHPNSLEMQTYLAATLNAEGRYAEAEKLARRPVRPSFVSTGRNILTP